MFAVHTLNRLSSLSLTQKSLECVGYEKDRGSFENHFLSVKCFRFDFFLRSASFCCVVVAGIITSRRSSQYWSYTHPIQELVPIWWAQCTFYFCLENRVDFFFVLSFVGCLKWEFFRRHSWRSVHGRVKSHTLNLPSEQMILHFTFSTFWFFFLFLDFKSIQRARIAAWIK